MIEFNEIITQFFINEMEEKIFGRLNACGDSVNVQEYFDVTLPNYSLGNQNGLLWAAFIVN